MTPEQEALALLARADDLLRRIAAANYASISLYAPLVVEASGLAPRISSFLGRAGALLDAESPALVDALGRAVDDLVSFQRRYTAAQLGSPVVAGGEELLRGVADTVRSPVREWARYLGVSEDVLRGGIAVVGFAAAALLVFFLFRR